MTVLSFRSPLTDWRTGAQQADHNPAMSPCGKGQQHPPSWAALSRALADDSSPLTSHWWAPPGVLYPVLGSPVQQTHWSESRKRPWRWLRFWSMCCMRRRRFKRLSLLSSTHWQNKRQWTQVKTHEIPSEQKTVVKHCNKLHKDVRKRYLTPNFMKSFTICSSWPCLSRVLGQDDT